MKKNILALIFITFFSYGAQAFDSNKEPQFSTNFVDGTKDIPLAKGLSKINDNELGFDSVNGSITLVYYKSENNLKEVQNFYKKTLPQMGWKIIKNKKKNLDNVSFRRDNEKLEIEFLHKNNFVKFFVEVISKE